MKVIAALLLSVLPLLAAQVVTAVPALEAIGKELMKKTEISILNPVGKELPLQELEGSIKESKGNLDSLAPSICAVLSLRSIMPEDYLYIQLRQKNIRIVEIDAASPLNPTLTSVGTIRTEEGINPYIWLAPSSVIRMAEIIGKDLVALFPKHQKQIESNLQELRSAIRSLQNEYEQKFLQLDRFEAATMDHSFDYLLKDINLFVTLQLPGEMSWEENHTKSFKNGVTNKLFTTVVHRWIPFGDPAEIAKKGGVSFSVLNTGLPGLNHFDMGIVPFLRSNLEALNIGLK